MEPLVNRFIDLCPWYVDDRQLSAAREEVERLAMRLVKTVSRMQSRTRKRSDLSAQRLRDLEARKARLIYALWIIEAEERRRREWPSSRLEKYVRIQGRLMKRILDEEERRALEPGMPEAEATRSEARARRARRSAEMCSQLLSHMREMNARLHMLRELVEWAGHELPSVSPVVELSDAQIDDMMGRVAHTRTVMKDALTRGGGNW